MPPVRHEAPRSVLSVDDGKRIIDHDAASGIVAVLLTGGEPLLYPRELTALILHAGMPDGSEPCRGGSDFFFVDAA